MKLKSDIEKTAINVTNHARKRFKERLGLPKAACLRQAQKAFDSGFTHAQAKGKAKRYMDSLFLKYRTANNLRVYGQAVYIFSGNTLITVMLLPVNIRKTFNINQCKTGEQ